MALILKLTKATSSDCKTLTITDSTGTYAAGTNPGGYGTPNDARTVLYLLFFMTHKKSAGDEAVTVPAYTALTVASWALTISEDGWYQAFITAAKAWASGSFIIGDIVYYTVDSKFYVCKANATTQNPTDTANWTEITKVSQLDTDTGLTARSVVDFWVDCFSQSCKAVAAIDYVSEKCDCVKDGSVYSRIRVLVEAAQRNVDEGNWAQAQKIQEWTEQICQDTGCGCGC